MVWDASFDSWRHFGVVRNSEAVLLDTDGRLLGDRFFGLDTERIDELLGTG